MRWLSDGERETIEQLRAEAAHDAGQDDETATCMHCGAEIEDDDPICRECETLDPEARNCDPAYPDVCIPPPPPDLSCKDIPYRRFRVLPPDPHGFDRDGDGIGCESK